ncbi:MAG: restriction endonuclease subunit S [Aquirhabdus sp.]
MSFDWVQLSFADAPLAIVDGDRGVNYPKQDEFSKNGHCLFLNTGNVTLDGFKFQECAFITLEKDNVLRKGKLVRNDIVLTTRGTLGNVGFYNERVNYNNIRINSGMVILRADITKLVPYFLFLFLRSVSFTDQVKSLKSGSAQPQLPIRDLQRVEIPVPPIEEQLKICKIMSVLDDRISLLRETNSTLEAIAQALFKSWFVDFDPVHAKQQGREPEGMDETTSALFPDCFEESELGLVPKGWRFGTVEDLATLNPEVWSARNHPDTVRYIDLANAKNNQIDQVTEYLFDDSPSRARRVLRKGDSIVGTVRPGNRSFAFIHDAEHNLTGSTGFAVLRPKAIHNTEFVFIAATQDSSIEHLAHLADGAAYPAVRPDVVANIRTILPTSNVMIEFHNAAEAIFAKVGENQKQAQILITLRDTLLPRLISGQLRLPEAETMLRKLVHESL